MTDPLRVERKKLVTAQSEDAYLEGGGLPLDDAPCRYPGDKVEGHVTAHFKGTEALAEMRERGKATLTELIGNVLTLYSEVLTPQDRMDVLDHHFQEQMRQEAARQDFTPRKEGQ